MSSFSMKQRVLENIHAQYFTELLDQGYDPGRAMEMADRRILPNQFLVSEGKVEFGPERYEDT